VVADGINICKAAIKIATFSMSVPAPNQRNRFIVGTACSFSTRASPDKLGALSNAVSVMGMSNEVSGGEGALALAHPPINWGLWGLWGVRVL